MPRQFHQTALARCCACAAGQMAAARFSSSTTQPSGR